MDREQDDRIQKLQDSGVELYSISKLDTINQCLYQAYCTYVLHKKGKQNVYACMGTKLHETLEDITNGKATESDLISAMNDEIEMMDMLDIRFPSDSIRESWIKDITHFCKTYKNIPGKFATEELFIYKTDDGHYLRGYIDLIRYNDDGTISIFDHKSSSMYSKQGIEEHAKQLLVYMLGKEQDGFKVDKICWHFMKYADITFFAKKTARSKEKTWQKKTIERKKIGAEMAKFVEQELYEIGYDEIDTEFVINELKDSNKFDCLPDEIKDHYKMDVCIVDYPITDAAIAECKKYIKDTIDKWESLNREKLADFPPLSFTKKQKNGKEVADTFFCSQLCDHSKHCPYLQDFLDQQDKAKDEDDDLSDLF